MASGACMTEMERRMWVAVDAASTANELKQAIGVFSDYWEERDEAAAEVIRLALQPSAPMSDYEAATGASTLSEVVREMNSSRRRLFACHCVDAHPNLSLKGLEASRRAVHCAMEFEFGVSDERTLKEAQDAAWGHWREIHDSRPRTFRFPVQNLAWASVRASGAASRRLCQGDNFADAFYAAQSCCTYEKEPLLIVAMQYGHLGRAVLPTAYLRELCHRESFVIRQ